MAAKVSAAMMDVVVVAVVPDGAAPAMAGIEDAAPVVGEAVDSVAVGWAAIPTRLAIPK